MRIDVLTLFPDMFTSVLNSSILKRAIDNNIIEVNLIDFREFTTNKHKKVDDYPYGGGKGMLLSVEPLYNALSSIEGGKRIILGPQGKTFNNDLSKELSKEAHIVLVCGHYEGFDERIRSFIDDEISIGDYVLTGGELGAMVMIDSITRFVKGALGNEDSHENDSFNNGLLEHPHYTKPQEFMGMTVPEVLLSGNHKNIDEYRRYESLRVTYEKRPDLLEKVELTEADEKMLQKIREAKRNAND